MKFCIHIDIAKMYPMRLSNDICDWLSFYRGSNSEKNETIAKWHLSSVEALPSAKFWKSENGPNSWTEWNILINFCVNIDIDKIKPKRLRTDIFNRSSLCRAPNSEKWKMALSLELWRILWWNFAYTLILTRCSQWDRQIIFGIGRGFAEVQILKKMWNWPYPLNLLI